MGKIRIGIVGVGNCASALVQGIEYYRKNGENETIGLMHYDLGGYKPEDIQVVVAFDVDSRKVGKPLSRAIFTKPNCTNTIFSQIPDNGVIVKMGEVLDGVAAHMTYYPHEETFLVGNEEPCDVMSELKRAKCEILLNFLPVGSEKATEFYVQACLDAGVGFINCMPVFIASNSDWARIFDERGLPLIGDDIKSQLGATIVHRVLANLFTKRGVKLERTYQLNFGGNTDFLNMLERSRLNSKKISKTEAVQSQLNSPLDSENIHIGPSDYVPWQKDNKVCFIRMEGKGFGSFPISLDLRLSVEDSPNSAGVVIDAIRCCKLALDRGITGVLTSISAYAMKHPPVQYSDDEARQKVEDFISGNIKR